MKNQAEFENKANSVQFQLKLPVGTELGKISHHETQGSHLFFFTLIVMLWEVSHILVSHEIKL